MKFWISAILLLLLVQVIAQTQPNQTVQQVIIETPFGNMKAVLYNETPQHRDNFIKLAQAGFFDSLLFHRVINKFMIQGGDPESRQAPQGKMLGNGGPGYDIPAEFNRNLYHQKGALAAAREGDQVNPEKKSSGSQFYIVMGQPVTAQQLIQTEERINFPIRRDLVMNYLNNPANSAIRQKADSLQRIQNYDELNAMLSQIAAQLDDEYQKQDLFRYSPDMIKTYTTLGGTPHLDQGYTVFGQIIEGLNIIDSIAAVKTDRNDRPLTDVKMVIKPVK